MTKKNNVGIQTTNIRLTCPVCGRTSYYVAEDPEKNCRQCGHRLEDTAQPANTPALEGEKPNRVAMRDASETNFLLWAQLNQIEVVVIVTNGYQLKCRIHSFDDTTIVVDNGSAQSLVYKHAISTITPTMPRDRV